MGGKSAVSSTAIIGAIVVVIMQVALLFGYAISETDAAALRTVLESGVLVVTALISIGGGIASIVGRWRATQ